jgi:hypothetical protein
MKYIQMDVSWNPKIIGSQNGVFQAEYGKISFDNETIYKEFQTFFLSNDYWTYYQKITPPAMPKYMRLLKSSIMTDFLRGSPHIMCTPFCVNKRVVDVMTNFNIQTHTLYPVELYNYQKVLVSQEYNFFYCPYLSYEVIDFKKSILWRAINPAVDKIFFQVNDIEEFEKFIKAPERGFYNFEKIVLNNSAPKDLDLYSIRPIGEIFVSEHLKNAFDDAKLTGLVERIGPLSIELVV